MNSKVVLFLTASVVVLGALGSVQAGYVVANNDEWTLSNSGFSNGDSANFALNTASLFTGGGTGSFLVYSNNFGLTQSSLASTMIGGGHSWTVDTSAIFNVATLSLYDGVFVGGYAADNGVLVDYVNAGGNVYVMAGTASLGGSAGEAAAWNPFLDAFGLAYTSTYNGISGTTPISSSHPLFSGVSSLYQQNGNSIVDLQSSDPMNQVLVSFEGHGLYAIYDPSAGTGGPGPGPDPVPAPGAFLLASLGAGAVGFMRRRRTL